MRLIFSGKRAMEALGFDPVPEIVAKSLAEKPSRINDLGWATQKINLLRVQKMNSSDSICSLFEVLWAVSKIGM